MIEHLLDAESLALIALVVAYMEAPDEPLYVFPLLESNHGAA